MQEQLIEQTLDLYDGFAFLVGGVLAKSRPRTDSPTLANVHYRGALLLLRPEGVHDKKVVEQR